MSRKYEIVYIFDSAMEEAQITESLDRFHALLKNQDYPEPITATNHWGKRTLAYPINKKEQGYYVVAQFESDQKLLNEFERAIKLDVNVLRYLVVINEGLATAPVIPERAESEYDKRDAGRPKKRAEDGDKAETPAEDADKPETPAEDAGKPETPAEVAE